MKVAIYPGTFDPITFGHIDLIKKGLRVVDKIFVAISSSENKKHLFNETIIYFISYYIFFFL